MNKTDPGQLQSVSDSDSTYVVHIQRRYEGIGYLCVCDNEYPMRAAYTVIRSLQEDTDLNDAIVKYQDPVNADKILKINKDLDETISIIQKTISSVLDRGEKIEDLVAKSNDLSTQSKLFYKNSSDLNRCCCIT